MRRIKITSLFIVALLLVGCLSPSIRLSLTPGTIKIQQGDEELVGLILTARMSGFSISYHLDKITMVLYDENGEQVHVFGDVEIDEDISVVSGLKHTEAFDPISLDFLGDDLLEEYYGEALQGKEYELVITMHGTKDSTTKVKVIFE